MTTSAPGISVSRHERDPWTIVAVEGEVDLSTAPALREALTSAAEGGAPRVAVDLRRVAFMDSMGLGVLVGARRRQAEKGGELVLICAEGQVARVLDVSGLASVFSIVRDDAELDPR